MDNYLLIHGKPLENDYYCSSGLNGLEERINRSYFERMEREFLLMPERERLEIKTISFEGIVYSAYSLVLSKKMGISDKADRGSYIVLTYICKEQYCRNIRRLYNLLKQTYFQIKDKTGVFNNNSQYVVSLFSDREKELNHLEQEFYSIIEKSFFGDFFPLDNSFVISKTNKEVEYFNISDVDCEAFFDIIRKKGEVNVSEDYYTRAQIISELQKEANKVNSLSEANEKLKQEVLSLQQEKDKRKNTMIQPPTKSNNNLEELNRLKEENKNLKNTIEEILNKSKKIKGENVDVNSELSPSDVIQKQVKDNHKKSKIIKWLPFIDLSLLVLCFVVLCINTFQVGGLHQAKDDVAFIKEQTIKNMFNGANIAIVKNKGKLPELRITPLYQSLDSSKGKWCVKGGELKIIKSKYLSGNIDTSFTVSYEYYGIKVLEKKIKHK